MLLKRASFVLAGSLLALSAFAQVKDWKQISGDYYDWKKTMQPERPWLHDYSQTLVMKFFIAERDANGNLAHVYMRYDDALEEIKKLDRITLGVPKIVYLVGWQSTGHDSGFPAFSVMNEALKRPGDKTALESWHWLCREAKKYHTSVSVHINMLDAYQNSPLWNTYLDNNIIIKDKQGIPVPGEVFGGLQSYQVDYAQEWKLGYAVKRIDGLLKMLPELKDASTIHIDAFHSIPWLIYKKDPNSHLVDPYLGTTEEEETIAQRKIYRYFRLNGIDATAEQAMEDIRLDPFIGLEPFGWHFEDEGDSDRKVFNRLEWIGKPADFDVYKLPPRLYVGTAMPAEQDIKNHPENYELLIKAFCTRFVPWYYRNNAATEDKHELWQKTGDIFLPVLWQRHTILAFSTEGYVSKKWKLPEKWQNRQTVTVTTVSIDADKDVYTLPIMDGAIIVTLNANQGVVIQ
ncbi:MAG: endo-alpha-N-acetylgalactosaminidase family protein [Terriglobia bacterium]|jgi:hypothetical protein